jgi:hypothetical protein
MGHRDFSLLEMGYHFPDFIRNFALTTRAEGKGGLEAR